MECISNASYVVATMTSQCRYDVTDAAAVASERIALYREAAEYIESYRQRASAEGASTEHDRRRGSSGVGAICC